MDAQRGAFGHATQYDREALKTYAASMSAAAMYWPAGFDYGQVLGHLYPQQQSTSSPLIATTPAHAPRAPVQLPNSAGSIGTNTSSLSSSGGSSAYNSPATSAPGGEHNKLFAGAYTAQTNACPPMSVDVQQAAAATAYPALASGTFTPCSTTSTGAMKKKPNPVPIHMKDETYWERRRRNNDSARRSRECRRSKEDGIALRVVYLEQENLQLRTEMSMLRNDTEKLRILLYQAQQQNQQLLQQQTA